VLQSFIVFVHAVLALAIIGVVLMQKGKGADAGAGFGSGASGTVFGARGSATFLSKTTAVLATLFFVCTLGLAYFGTAQPRTSSSVLEGAVQPVAPAAVPGAAQIPGNEPAAGSAASAPAAPAAPGAGQIPAK